MQIVCDETDPQNSIGSSQIVGDAGSLECKTRSSLVSLRSQSIGEYVKVVDAVEFMLNRGE